MLRIARFAQVAGVTTRLLRHYDAIGLFQPAHVDPQTGYRYYRLDQLPRLHRILALRTLELPLPAIRQLLVDDPTLERGEAILRSHQQALEARMMRDFARWRATRHRLEQLRDRQPEVDIVFKPLKPLHGLQVHAALTPEESIGGLFDLLSHTLRERGWYTHVEAIIGVYPRHALLAGSVSFPFPFEAFYAMSRLPQRKIALNEERIFEPAGLRRVPIAACLLHTGAHRRLFESYRLLLAHIADVGYCAVGAPREVYLQTRGAPESWLTEIQLPVEPLPHGDRLPLNVPA